MENLAGEAISAAPGSGWTVRIPLPAGNFSHGMVARFVV
jgi:hypothetical protein